MTDLMLSATELDTAALMVNAVLLLAMGIVMIFAKRIDTFMARLRESGPPEGFFPGARRG